jgi:hypothetical protein
MGEQAQLAEAAAEELHACPDLAVVGQPARSRPLAVDDAVAYVDETRTALGESRTQ